MAIYQDIAVLEEQRLYARQIPPSCFLTWLFYGVAFYTVMVLPQKNIVSIPPVYVFLSFLSIQNICRNMLYDNL